MARFFYTFRSQSRLDRAFEIGVFLKGVDGFLELVGGIMLLLVAQNDINSLVRGLTQYSLTHGHNEIAALVEKLGAAVVGGTLLPALYLIAHGLVKVVLVVAVLRRQLWAYPAMIGLLVIFIFYQLYLIAANQSLLLVLLTIFDAVVVWLTWAEYGRMRRMHGREPA